MHNADYFQHNNMVPFFGSSLRTNHGGSAAHESRLDAQAGSGSQYFSKSEQSPMFSPQENMQWAYGTPNSTDFIQSRVNPSMSMAGVKPFADEKVGPGLGLGYTTEGAGGFNAGMGVRDQWLDPTVDQLRAANKPKSSGHMLYGHEGPATSYIKTNATVDQMGLMERHGVDGSFELVSKSVAADGSIVSMGQDRLFTTMGSATAPTLRAIDIQRNQARTDTTVSYAGIAQGRNPGIYTDGEHMPSHRQQFGAVPIMVANAQGRGYANEGDYGIQGQTQYTNNRMANGPTDYFGIIGGAMGAVVSPLLDVLRPSRRENTIGTLRPYQNPGSTVTASYVVDPMDQTNVTIRQTTENAKFHPNVNANQYGGAYKVAGVQASETHRRTTDPLSSYVGGSSANGGTRQPRPYDSEYNQRNNDLKASTVAGRMVPGNMDLMNHDMNVQSDGRRETDMRQGRAAMPSGMPAQSPDVVHLGRMQEDNHSLYSNIQLDRNEPSILSSLKGNPYALSVTGGL